MTLQTFKEQFNGAYDGVSPATILPVGGISDGLNVRKVSQIGGWKPRKGCTFHNTSQVSGGKAVLSLHQYTHPRNGDYHFIAQTNGNLYDATNDPPASGTTFGSSIYTSASSTTPGFSDVVGSSWFYADGSTAPVMWGGAASYCSGFVVWDNSASMYVDYTKDVVDGDSSTYAIVLGAASDVYYVCSPCRAKGITLDLGTSVNSNAATATVKSWQSGAWSDRTASDGTASGGATHAIDGSLTWTKSASDTMTVINGIMGYWYQVSFSAALSGSVSVISCKVQYDPEIMTNKWNGVWEYPLAVRYYNSAGEYVDYTGKVTDIAAESTSQYMPIGGMTTSQLIYIKTAEPVTGFGFGVVDGYENTAAYSVSTDDVEYWDGDKWATCTPTSDETKPSSAGFAHSGTIWVNGAALSPRMTKQSFDSVPGYWYRINVSGTLSSDVRIYAVTYVPFPESLRSASGVVEFKGRLLAWGDPRYPNRLRYSAKGFPDCFSGSDSGWTEAFGNEGEIVRAIRFYNELIVFKKDSVWLLEGYSPATFGALKLADTVGLCSAPAAAVVEAGNPSMHRLESLSIAIWPDTDGVYALDGRKPRKVSFPIDHYFNTEYSTALAASELDELQCFIDPLNNEYHLLAPVTGVELVYNYVTDEWYPPWTRHMPLQCGIHLRGTDGRYYTYGGTAYLSKASEVKEYDCEESGTDTWVAYNTPTANERSSAQVYAGTYSRKFTSDAANDGVSSTGDRFSTVTSRVYRVIAQIYTSVADAIKFAVCSGSGAATPYDTNQTGLVPTSWNEINFSYTESAGGSSAYLTAYDSEGDTGDFYLDDIHVYENCGGYVLRLEYDTTDKDSGGNDVVITHTIKTRAVSAVQKQATTFEFLFRRAWIEAKAQSSGSITTTFYRDMAVTGVELTMPSAMSLVNSGYGVATPRISGSKPNCSCFQLEFSSSTADQEMELWSFIYQLEVEGELE